jgi:hypothetical protein
VKKNRLFPVPILLVSFLLLSSSALRAKGKFELGVHYGSWGINILKGAIESGVSSAMRDQMIDSLQKTYPDAVQNSNRTSMNFDSGGYNLGFDLRWYPGGETGSFSLGVSVEKTKMRLSIDQASADISVSYTDTDGKYKTESFNGSGTGEFLLNPLSFHLSVRWDVFPSARIHPYITLGAGVSPGSYLDDGTLNYAVKGDLIKKDGTLEHHEDSGTKTLGQLRKEEEDDARAKGKNSDIPFWFIPFVQLNLGLKGKITDNIHLLVDAGIWDGLLIRGGIAYRF